MDVYSGHRVFELAVLARMGGTVAGLTELPLQWSSVHLRNDFRWWASQQSPALLMLLVGNFPQWTVINAAGLNAVLLEDVTGARLSKPMFLSYTSIAYLIAPSDVLMGNLVEVTGSCCSVATQCDLYLKFVP